MNDPFPEELLSAYLDGELPREERARVEEWLAASADHRRLFDDLQAIRRELQALPHQSLDTGFSDRVLAVIRERSGDSSASPPVASGASAIDAHEPTPSVSIKPASLPPRHLGMPAWRWFAAGVAATLAAVLVGINAAPDTMAEIGKLAQVRSQDRKGREETKSAQQPISAPAATTPAPSETAGGSLGTAAQGDADSVAKRQVESQSFSAPAEKETQDQYVDRGEQSKAAVADKRVEKQAEGPSPGGPDRTASAPSPPGASSGDKFREGDGPEPMLEQGNELLPPQTAAQYDNVVELPVTSQQADRALAYAQTAERESVRRSLSNVDTVQNLAAKDATEYAAAKSIGLQERETELPSAAAGMTLMKLMDATTQGVQVAALEVTGTEAEIKSLLDSLGVATRDLRPEPAFGGGSGGGGIALRAAREGEEAVPRAALPAGAEAKPAAAALDNDKQDAKADGAAEKSEPAKGGGERRYAAGRGAAGGAFPTVKMKMQSGFGGADPLRDQVRRARDSQQEGLDATQPQLRVRLVIVPQADPIGPTVEVKPLE